jgi:transposase
MSATHNVQVTTGAAVLHMSIELSYKSWKLGFAVGLGHSPRIRTIAGGDYDALVHEIRLAKVRFKLPQGAPVRSCYEAGPHAFHPHRCLLELGIENIVVDSSSIETSRRRKRAKSDRLDASKLATMLVRWNLGDKKTWRVVNVPSIADEDRRQLHRELISLKKERTKHVNCMKSLLFAAGFGVRIDRTLPQQLEKLHQLASPPLPANLYQRLLREFERWSLVNKQINDIDTERVRRIRTDQSQHMDMVRRLLSLRAVGENSAWLLVQEVFGWREIKNRRQLGGLAGLSPTPYNSGDSEREQGISKAGNTRLRGILVELAWSWLRYQPNSALTLWYKTRFAAGNSRLRRIGIVALARKLLVALWKYLDRGEVPEGAELVPWPQKLGVKEDKVA